MLLLVGFEPLRAVEFEEGVDDNRVALDALVILVANRSPNFDERALFELSGCFSARAEDDAAVPFGERRVLSVLVLEASGSRHRKRGKGAAILGVGLGAIAEVADEDCEVRVHDCVSVLKFPNLLGSHRAEPSEWAMLPSAEALHLRKVRKIYLRSLHKDFLKTVKAEERVADGRMKSPEAVIEHDWDCSAETYRRTWPPSLLRLPPFTENGLAHVWPTARVDKNRDASDVVRSPGCRTKPEHAARS